MKSVLALLVIFSFLLFQSSCVSDECETTYTYMAYEPVYLELDDLKEDIDYVDQRVLENPGKFYYYGNFVLISERDEGVHIIDNSDKTNPEKIGFIKIQGNQDIALRENYLYADTRYNIVVVDIGDLENPEVVHCINDVKNIYQDLAFPGRVAVDFVLTEQTQTFDCEQFQGNQFWSQDLLWVQANRGLGDVLQLDAPALSSGSEVSFGAGSLSRMAMIGDHFYYINESTMHVFDIAELDKPDQLNTVYLDWGVETIFPYQDKLFIGANNGMHIFDNADPSSPEYLSTFAHARACDPVVVEGTYAYVTLRDGNECTNFINQLDVVDVSNLLEPQLVASYRMHNPHGLSVRDNILYLCDAEEGLKIFDVSDVETVHENQLGQVKDYFAYDAISVSSQLLLMIGEDGFYQFDTNNPSDPKLLSTIETGQ